MKENDVYEIRNLVALVEAVVKGLPFVKMSDDQMNIYRLVSKVTNLLDYIDDLQFRMDEVNTLKYTIDRQALTIIGLEAEIRVLKADKDPQP